LIADKSNPKQASVYIKSSTDVRVVGESSTVIMEIITVWFVELAGYPNVSKCFTR
jgi:hypothetical protein